jgi:ligand-binding sensor domain-containing protein
VSDIFEDSHHQLWIAQWSGGLLRFNSRQKQFEEAEWPLEVAPSSIVEDNIHHCLWIGTIS